MSIPPNSRCGLLLRPCFSAILAVCFQRACAFSLLRARGSTVLHLGCARKTFVARAESLLVSVFYLCGFAFSLFLFR